MEFIIDGSKLYQALIVYGKNEFLKLSFLQLRLISISNIVTNFTFKNKIVKVFGYNNIYNFAHTKEPLNHLRDLVFQDPILPNIFLGMHLELHQ